MKNNLLLIDGSSYIFRAFYGVRAGLTNKKGLPTNAVFGFKNMLLQLLKQENPSHCIMVFDRPGPTFRNTIYPDYKANRDEAPDDLKVQFDPIYEFNRHLNMPIVWRDGFEADDIIGSLAKIFSPQIEITIISGDKDLTQLVTDEIYMLDTMKNKRYTPESVKEKFGVGPEMIHEYLAMVGDSSDNIPGAKGVGPKTAVKLFDKFGSIEGIYENVSQLKGKQKENIESSRANVEMSLRLTKIDCNMEFEAPLDDYARKEPDLEKLSQFYEEMGFRPDDFITLHPDAADRITAEEKSEKENKKLNYDQYQLVTTEEQLDLLQKTLLQQTEIAMDFETSSLAAVEAMIVGISFAWEGGQPVYIPVDHVENTPQLPLTKVLDILSPVLQKKDLTIIGQNIKYEMMVLANYNIEIGAKIQDTMIQSYLLDANLRRHNLNELAERHLDHQMIKFEDVAGKGKKQIPFAEVPLQEALRYAAEDSDATLQIHHKLWPKLNQENLEELYNDVEMPLCRTLAKIETNGVKINVPYLKLLCDGLNSDLEGLRQKIYFQAGEEFNINSPQQLGIVLFEKLGIEAGKKKTKSGYSTDASILEKVARENPIADDLLSYRTKNKLVNTYLDVLPSLISEKTGRIHTSYSQTVAATGRLSSRNPNLQNIPIRGKDGNKIRKAFIAENDNQIVSADYSQVELRFLAHLSGDEGLIKVFQRNGDIHTETAAAIYNISNEEVSSHQRYSAKAINFGIIYGMGAFRLSQEIGVSNKQAKMFIESYFEKYPKIKSYMDETIAFCREHSFVQTIFNRKRTIPDINSKNHLARTASERVAINSRIQGSAADLIKIAMIQIQKKLEENRFQTKMIMQVHDELVFEAPKDECAELIPMVKTMMEKAITLEVPLIVEIASGENWQEAH